MGRKHVAALVAASVVSLIAVPVIAGYVAPAAGQQRRANAPRVSLEPSPAARAGADTPLPTSTLPVSASLGATVAASSAAAVSTVGTTLSPLTPTDTTAPKTPRAYPTPTPTPMTLPAPPTMQPRSTTTTRTPGTRTPAPSATIGATPPPSANVAITRVAISRTRVYCEDSESLNAVLTNSGSPLAANVEFTIHDDAGGQTYQTVLPAVRLRHGTTTVQGLFPVIPCMDRGTYRLSVRALAANGRVLAARGGKRAENQYVVLTRKAAPQPTETPLPPIPIVGAAPRPATIAPRPSSTPVPTTTTRLVFPFPIMTPAPSPHAMSKTPTPPASTALPVRGTPTVVAPVSLSPAVLKAARTVSASL